MDEADLGSVDPFGNGGPLADLNNNGFHSAIIDDSGGDVAPGFENGGDLANLNNANSPVAIDQGPGATTFQQNGGVLSGALGGLGSALHSIFGGSNSPGAFGALQQPFLGGLIPPAGSSVSAYLPLLALLAGAIILLRD